VQLALINLDSNSNVDDGFVFVDCRRNITSGLTQVASFMLTARNIVIVMSWWRWYQHCVLVSAVLFLDRKDIQHHLLPVSSNDIDVIEAAVTDRWWVCVTWWITWLSVNIIRPLSTCADCVVRLMHKKKLLSSCLIVIAACIYLYLMRLQCLPSIRHIDKINVTEGL